MVLVMLQFICYINHNHLHITVTEISSCNLNRLKTLFKRCFNKEVEINGYIDVTIHIFLNVLSYEENVHSMNGL